MIADTGTLTTVLDGFLSVLKVGKADVGSQAFSLLTILATIELLMASLWWALTGQDALVGLIKKLLSVGFFVFIITNYDNLLHVVVDGFIQTGKLAGSKGGGSFTSLKDPSSIVEAGFIAAQPIFEHLSTYSSVSALANPVDVLIALFCAVGTLLGYFIIAIQVFVTYLEFGIVSTLGLILIPFGVQKHTSFLCEKVFGAIISFGVKLMVLGLLVSITVPVLKTFSVPADPTWTHLFNLLLVTFAGAALAWHAPGVAAGMLSGGPSLTAGTAADSMRAGGAATLAAAFTPAIAAQAGSRATKIGSSIGKGLGTIAGTVAGGGAVARNIAKSRGASQLTSFGATAIGATSGPFVAGGVKTGGAVASAARSMKASYDAGRREIPGYLSIEAKRFVTPPPPSSTSEQPKAAAPVSKVFGKGISPLLRSTHFAKQSIPPTAHPHGGMTTPIKHEDKEGQ
jgi:type IV secretion system protein TrbL